MRILASGSPPPLPGFLNSVSGPLDHYGYWAIALLLLLENIGVPVIPGELAMIAGAIFAGSGRAGLNIVGVGIVAVIAAVAGAQVGYLIGKYAGRELILHYGKYILIKPHHLDRAEAIVSRYGGIVVVIARYIVGLREANGIIAGITEMRWATFSMYNLIGACAWVATWATIGDVAGSHIDAIYKNVNHYALYVFIVLAVLLAAYIIQRVWRGRRGTRGAAAGARAGNSPETQESPEAEEGPEVEEMPVAPAELEAQGKSEAQESSGIDGREPAAAADETEPGESPAPRGHAAARDSPVTPETS
jgi:membrane protein DedA with SNARE-associated domain